MFVGFKYYSLIAISIAALVIPKSSIVEDLIPQGELEGDRVPLENLI
jgi:hypothetical protein